MSHADFMQGALDVCRERGAELQAQLDAARLELDAAKDAKYRALAALGCGLAIVLPSDNEIIVARMTEAYRALGGKDR